ncbi:MAG: DUF4422 domain-containing protein [Dorea sp.]|nr:DUF4422 domain-containing protein [Dorea sp.]
MDLAIFGAQAIALGAYQAIHNLCPSRKIRCFLVTERGINGEFLADKPVLELDFFAALLSEKERENIEILIATPENMMPMIEESLEKHGLFCHVRLTSPRWSELMRYHYISKKHYMPLCVLPVGYHGADVHIFMAKSNKDKPLNESYALPKWITPIQVGAVLCRERVASLLDCEGENISAKNSNYSELTALYWIWKNKLMDLPIDSDCEYYGLAHYRRIMELSEDDLLRLIDNEVDVVLPFPMPYEPNIEEHHRRYLKAKDWDAVLKAIKEVHPEFTERFDRILQQKFFYNYNILLAKKRVLVDYCEWLFPILERVEGLSVPKAWERSDRYMGYVAETLETLYFMCQKDKLNILHTGCRFLT